MKIYQIFSRSALRNFSYLIVFKDESEREVAICIDPYDAHQIMNLLKNHSLQLKAIINTHEHGDHFAGNEGLVKETLCQVWGPSHVKKIIPGLNRELVEGEKIFLGSKKEFLEVFKTPGHTFNHICLMAATEGRPYALFTGDTLFNAGVGNCRGGNAEMLFKTIKNKFYPLGEEILIYPGHEYLEKNLNFTLHIEEDNAWAEKILREKREAREGEKEEVDGFPVFTLGQEKQYNTFLRLREEKVAKGLLRIFGQSETKTWDEKDIFLNLRALRDQW